MQIYYEVGVRMLIGAILGVATGFALVYLPPVVEPILIAGMGISVLLFFLFSFLGGRIGVMLVGLTLILLAISQYVASTLDAQLWTMVNQIGSWLFQSTTPSVYASIFFWTCAGAILFSTIGLPDAVDEKQLY